MNEIRIALKTSRLVPAGQTTDAWDVLLVQNLIYEPLVRGQDGHMMPALARGWMAFDEGRRWEFYLRDGAVFSDGEPCTAQDIVNAFEEMRNSVDSFGMPWPFSRYMKDIRFVAKDAKTVETISPYPNGDEADFLSEIPIRKHCGDALIGTGVYKMTEFAAGDHITLVKRDEIDSPAAYDKVTFLLVADANERLAMLKDGRVDIAYDLDQLDPVPFDEAGLLWKKSANTLSVMAFLNGYEAPFNDVKARRAVNLAVNKQRIIERIWHGQAIPAATAVSPFHTGAESALEPMAYDPEEAKKLFSECEMPEKLILRTPTFMPDRAAQVAELIAEDLRAIGLTVELDVKKERPEYAREVGAKKTGHIALFDSSPHSSYRVLSDKISSRNLGIWWQGISDSTVDDMIDEAHATVDVPERAKAYAKALNYLHENPFWLYLYHPVLIAGYNNPSIDFEITHEGLLRLPGTW